MFPFWDPVIAPAIRAVDARRIVEIGALRGDTTVRMLEDLGPDAELHVIDPVPAFDPSDHEKRFPGRYHFYRELSHQVLPDLPPVDVALIDGDHNWYTVYHELRLLAETSRRAGEALPLLVLHDVTWPYGRRDLYYAPEQIPEEFRQPYTQAGIMPEKKELAFVGGLNPTMNNAVSEGGPRNGVMTAVDDFVAEHDRPLRVLVLPIYFGLAIVADEQRLADHPQLEKLLDWLEGTEGRGELLELAEDVRLRAMITQHGVWFNAKKREEKAARRYLGVLKGALLNEHYLESELRLDYLARCLDGSLPLHQETARDPIRRMKEKARKLRAERESGRPETDAEAFLGEVAYTSMGRVRLDAIESRLATIREESVAGDLVEVGAGRGGGGVFLRGFAEIFNMHEPTIWVIDRFAPTNLPGEGHAPAAGAGESTDTAPAARPLFEPDLNHVREAFARFDLLDHRVRFLQGEPIETLPHADIDRIALLHVTDEPGGDPRVALDELYEKVSLGGFVVLDGYGDHEVRTIVDDFRSRQGISEPLERIDWWSVAWRKTTDATDRAPRTAETTSGGGARLAPPAPAEPCDLTVVVVFYNMRREAERTLYSLSRAYQQDLDDVDYEVVVVENGSDPDQLLGEELVSSFGPEFRYIDVGDEAAPSPIPALNRGIAAGRGRNFALMIDGAHVLTPGVLHYGLLGLSSYAPAVVSTQQWYVGPGQQGDVSREGYDQEAEDRLFDAVGWPVDGYRLFDVGHFIGERDWLDGMWESNCLFVPRKLLNQVGGFDESFAMPGGGFANLDLYERLGSSPEVSFTTILGEGSFHQIHGGTTTNEVDVSDRHDLLASYARHYEDLRGRGFAGHRKPIHYVGHMIEEARRTRARRRVAPNFFKPMRPDGPDGRPTKPVPIPQELRAEFVDAYWRSRAWTETRWLGHKIPKPPTDLFAYQELLHRVKPGWVIETGTGQGTRALFLASICDLLDHGQVLAITSREVGERPEHPRITYLTLDSTWGQNVTDRVREIVGDDPRALVILGSRGRSRRMVAEFNTYSPFVPVGSYVVMEDTIVNGFPVWADFGPGPAEAVKGIVETRGDWASDLNMDKYKLSFNPGGFIKRMS